MVTGDLLPRLVEDGHFAEERNRLGELAFIREQHGSQHHRGGQIRVIADERRQDRLRLTILALSVKRLGQEITQLGMVGLFFERTATGHDRLLRAIERQVKEDNLLAELGIAWLK